MARVRKNTVRVRLPHVEWVADRLGDRDMGIIDSVARLRLVTGSQLERLHFYDLAPSTRARVRRRVLARLVSWRVLMTLERRIGGVRAGSSGLVFTLDTAGDWLVRFTARDEGTYAPRRAETPSGALVNHVLTTSELYISLIELTRTTRSAVTAFMTEPLCWWPNGLGSWLKPDGYLVLVDEDHADAWWLEQDMGTEHLPTVRRKLSAYLDFANRGQTGQTGVVPRVLVSVPNERRQIMIEEMIRRLTDPASRLLHVTTAQQAPYYLLRVLWG